MSIPVIAGLCRAADAGLMGAAAVISVSILHRYGGSPRWGEAVVVSLAAIVVTCRVFGWLNLYSLAVLRDPTAMLARFAIGVGAGGAMLFGALALLQGSPTDWDWVGSYASAWCLVSGAAILASRSVVAWRMQSHARHDRLALKVAVVCAGSFGHEILARLAAKSGLSVLGLYDDQTRRCATSQARGTVAELVINARQAPVDAVVIAAADQTAGQISILLTQLAGLAADIYLARDQVDLASAARITEFAGLPVIRLVERPLPDWRGVSKAIFDRVLSGILLVLVLPLMSLIAMAIKATSPGPVLFLQTREGLNGAPFTMIKFRSMVHDPAADQSVQASRHDPRVTPLGFWLRRTSLDELPQLFNVLRGDMSLVGPRPHLATTCAGNRLFCDIVPGYAARHRVKPGLTGWAQVHGLRGEIRTEQQIADRIAHDLYYIENWSFAFDLRILLLTLLQEVRSRSGNAY